MIGLIIVCGSLGFNPFKADSAESIEYYANEVLSFIVIVGLAVLLLGVFLVLLRLVLGFGKSGTKDAEDESFGNPEL